MYLDSNAAPCHQGWEKRADLGAQMSVLVAVDPLDASRTRAGLESVRTASRRFV